MEALRASSATPYRDRISKVLAENKEMRACELSEISPSMGEWEIFIHPLFSDAEKRGNNIADLLNQAAKNIADKLQGIARVEVDIGKQAIKISPLIGANTTSLPANAIEIIENYPDHIAITTAPNLPRATISNSGLRAAGVPEPSPEDVAGEISASIEAEALIFDKDFFLQEGDAQVIITLPADWPELKRALHVHGLKFIIDFKSNQATISKNKKDNKFEPTTPLSDKLFERINPLIQDLIIPTPSTQA